MKAPTHMTNGQIQAAMILAVKDSEHYASLVREISFRIRAGVWWAS